VQNIVSLSAVGSLREDYKPGDFVVVDQFIDKTYLRQKTFFDDDVVVHIPMSSPVCKNLRNLSINILRKSKLKFHKSGTYVCIEGPQFSSQAESNLYRSWGCDIIGMTNMPEAKLAKEAGICYCALAMVTDFDCWHPNHDSVTIDQIVSTLNKNANNAFEFINKISQTEKIFCDEKTKNLSKDSTITDLDIIKKSTKQKLKHILKI
jgi:5'-methylthioadenosine phosphorylase